LQDYCLESICKDPHSFITSNTFPSLNKEILFGLYKYDEELVFWDSWVLIKHLD